MSFELISFITFIIFLGMLLYIDRKKIKIQGITAIRKTQKGRNFIDKTARKYKSLWDFLSVFSIGISVLALLFVSFFLINNSLGIIKGDVTEGVRLVLPWPSSEAEFTPGFLLLPWYFWVIGIMSVVVPHEFMHGIMCRTDKIRIKTIGWFLLLFIPGAFVEPDEKQLKKAPRKTKLKVYSAGSFANFMLAAIFAILGFIILNSFYSVGGIFPASAIEGYPVAKANVSGAITGINDVPIRSQEDLSAALQKIMPNTSITIQTTKGEFTITTAKHPDLNKAFIGISGPFSEYNEVSEPYKNYAEIIDFIRELFMWITVLNFGIGLVNMLPIKPLDGGLVFEELAGKFFKNSKPIINGVTIFMAFILLFNLFGPLLL